MKLTIIAALNFFSVFLFAQSHNTDFSKMNNKELIEVIMQRDKEINNLKDIINKKK